ncbi:MAG: pectate lyase, partial [Acidobacteria bacterium]|nr:pectate lyase [Acidobacteriota bacterium]
MTSTGSQMLNRVTIHGVGVTICLALFANFVSGQKAENAKAVDRINWSESLKQKPEWYASDEAVRIADNLLLYQRDTGGWPKNIEMARELTEAERAAILKEKQETDSNIDNGATYTQLVYLARVYTARKLARHKGAFE